MDMTEQKVLSESKIAQFDETLKRCPNGTLEALIRYRETGAVDALNTFLIGCIYRHTEPEYQSLLDGENRAVSFIDDLGIDSMTMMEIVMMAEECLEIQIDNQDLMKIGTVGDLNEFLKSR
jgi:acyl carrier protein